MFRSIRNQILIPLVAIQGAAVASVAIAAASLAARRSEDQIVARLNGVIDVLGHANFPYTEGVLAKMRGLSGAHFAAYGDDGRVSAATLPTLRDLPPVPLAGRPARRLESLREAPTLTWEQTRYRAVPVRASVGPHAPTLLVLYPETSWRQARWEAAAPPLVIGLVTVALLAAVAVWTAHRISGRIRGVQKHVARIAAGEFEEYDPGPPGDEVRDLSASINSMCVQLRQMRQTIQQTERTRLLAQLAAGLAHQLRNSLTGARMSIQLHAKRFPPRDGDETLGVALRQLEVTEEQVAGLLSLGRTDRRPRSSCELGQLMGEVTRLVGPWSRHARVDLRQRLGAGPIRVVADEAGLRAAVLNLAMNAIEAAGPGGEVDLGASAGDGEVTVEVRDSGAGPPDEVASSLFEAFVTSKSEGVGLGLALAHRVAAEHGGRLSWSRDGGRTRFRLQLPTAEAQP